MVCKQQCQTFKNRHARKFSILHWSTAIENQQILLEELKQTALYKPKGRPPYSAAMIRFALHLRYTSLQAYKLLLEKFPLPSISILNKIQQGFVDALKSLKVLRDKGEISNDLILMFDEMYCTYKRQPSIKQESTSVLTRRVTFIKESWHLWSLVWKNQYHLLFKLYLKWHWTVNGYVKKLPTLLKILPVLVFVFEELFLIIMLLMLTRLPRSELVLIMIQNFYSYIQLITENTPLRFLIQFI